MVKLKVVDSAEVISPTVLRKAKGITIIET